ncbi:MAG TPA: sigma-54 dependent transcriptional regulator, partial [Blastocatellia bacterium]|nr:sigma-54 dependent transcriptional regulator [Blastocatellia bacterium]
GAEKHLCVAMEVFNRLGAQPDLTRTQRALADLAPLAMQPSPEIGPRAIQERALRSRLPKILEQPPQTEVMPSLSSDVLLMQRLIEASDSRELLLQEMASVVYENFPADIVVVGGTDDSGAPEPVVAQGMSLPDAFVFCRDLNASSVESGKHQNGITVVHLATATADRIERPGRTRPTFLLLKPSNGLSIDLARLHPLIKQVEFGLEACALRESMKSTAPVRLEHRTQTVMPGFIIGSPLMFDVIEKIRKIKTSDVTVLITGESGTGKELVARAVHAESAKARAIFLPFNCSATPRDLIESQLFGHRRGAFTGATANYPGVVKAADGGTLFLDEIGDLALEVQPKLMRFLQEGEIQPLGETRPLRVDVRVIAATNTELERAVADGRFREALFHRLNIIRIHVPPLRERREEIATLASFFLDHFASRSGKQGISLGQDALDALTEYEWPGNVRQLRNELERVTAYAAGAVRIGAGDLSPEVGALRKRLVSAVAAGISPEGVTVGGFLGSRPPEGSSPTRSGKALWGRPEDSSPPPSSHNHNGDGNGRGHMKLREATAELETRLITDALVRNSNNLSRAATELGLSRRGLRLKLAQLGIARNIPL